MAADNTSGFNCRNAVSTGPPRWSAHAYGRAIDVNPVENPYVLGGRVLPPAGARFLDRRAARRGIAVEGGALVARLRARRLGLGRPLVGARFPALLPNRRVDWRGGRCRRTTGLGRRRRDAVRRPAGAAAARLRPRRCATCASPTRPTATLSPDARQRRPRLPRPVAATRTPPAGALEGARRAALDGIGADERGIRPRGGLGWWDGMIGPGKAVRHRPLLRHLLQPARRLPRLDRAGLHEPRHRPAVRLRLPGGHGRRHGARAARASSTRSGSTRCSAPPAARSAGCRRSSGRSPTPTTSTRLHRDRLDRAPRHAGRRLERGRAQRDHGRPGLAGRRLLRHRPRARTRASASRAWSATSRTSRASLDARRSSAGGCRSATTYSYA